MPTLARILIVEDVATDAELIEREIRRAGIGCATRRVDTETAVRDALRSFAPDLVLTDHSMPRLSARDTLRLVAQEGPDKIGRAAWRGRGEISVVAGLFKKKKKKQSK